MSPETLFLAAIASDLLQPQRGNLRGGDSGTYCAADLLTRRRSQFGTSRSG